MPLEASGPSIESSAPLVNLNSIPVPVWLAAGTPEAFATVKFPVPSAVIANEPLFVALLIPEIRMVLPTSRAGPLTKL